MKIKNLSSIIVVFVISFFSLISCKENNKTLKEKSFEKQENIMNEASKQTSVPDINNYLTRKTVAKWMERMDQPSKTFYIYILSDNGNFVGYHVAKYRPVSVGTYLTPTYQEYETGDNCTSCDKSNPIGPAPSLDGTYRSMGGDASAYYFFDAETDAYIELTGLNYIVSDQPFNIDAPKLSVEVEKK